MGGYSFLYTSIHQPSIYCFAFCCIEALRRKRPLKLHQVGPAFMASPAPSCRPGEAVRTALVLPPHGILFPSWLFPSNPTDMAGLVRKSHSPTFVLHANSALLPPHNHYSVSLFFFYTLMPDYSWFSRFIQWLLFPAYAITFLESPAAGLTFIFGTDYRQSNTAYKEPLSYIGRRCACNVSKPYFHYFH